jgi:tyrosyl-tRNA synthetase
MFTDLPLAEIARLENLKDAEINVAKEILATEATRLCHGAASAGEAAATAARAFAGGAAEGLPTFMLKTGEPVLIIDVAIALGMAASRSEARRLIDQGGVRLNDQTVQAATASVTAADLDSNGTARLTVGKKRHGLIRRG